MTDWDLSIASIIEEASLIENHTRMDIRNRIHLQIDRATILDPYDIGASTTRVQDIGNVISSRAVQYDATVSSTLQFPLIIYQITQLAMSVQFLTLSLL